MAKVIRNPLRIVILSTPKTGNTWLMNLLASMYELPRVGFISPFNYRQANGLGERWVAFHHFLPDPELVAWIQENKPVVLTTVRHPGDVLISLYHHLHGFQSSQVESEALKEMLTDRFERVNIEPAAIHPFHSELEISLSWKRSGVSRLVRYEDLRLDTLRTLQSLAGDIGPVSNERIEQAIERCDIGLMRSLADNHGRFFRSGKVGEWYSLLSPEVIAILRCSPYKEQFESLGYSLDAPAEIFHALNATIDRNPFRFVQQFNNGVPVVPIVVDFYLSLNPDRNAKWPNIAETGRDSFYAWMCSADENLTRGSSILVSRLAGHIYRSRPDLQQAFPDLSGYDRARYAQWFVRNSAEYRLDARLLLDTRTHLIAWGNARPPEDREWRPWWPKLTNYSLFLYRSKPELQAAFKDVFGEDRWNLLEWIISPNSGLVAFPEFITFIRRKLNRLRGLRSLISKLLPRR